MHACFVFWILLGSLVPLSVPSSLLGRLVAPQLAKHSRLELSIIQINEVDASQFLSIVELWFFDGPLLLFPFLSNCRTIFQAANNHVW